MFNPKNLPSLREKYKNLLDISGIVLSSTERPVLYKSYFELVERIKLMGLLKQKSMCVSKMLNHSLLTKIERSKNSCMAVIKY